MSLKTRRAERWKRLLEAAVREDAMASPRPVRNPELWMVALRRMGWTYQRIGDLLGVSRQRVHQLFGVSRK